MEIKTSNPRGRYNQIMIDIHIFTIHHMLYVSRLQVTLISIIDHINLNVCRFIRENSNYRQIFKSFTIPALENNELIG